MANHRLPDRVCIDWLTIVLPYSYKEVPLDEYHFESDHHNPVKAGKPTIEDYSLIDDFLKVLAIDGKRFTDFTIFRNMQNAKPYDTRYIRDGFDLRFNDLPSHYWYFSGESNNDGFMPVNRFQMGIKLDVQGRGCRFIEHALARDGHDWHWFFAELLAKFPNITFRRIDVAYDIFYRDDHLAPSGIYKRFERTRKAIFEGKPNERQVLTRRRNFKFYHGGELTRGNITGDTFYLSSGSNLMLRIYDKNAERIYSHGDTWRLSKDGKSKHYWTRYECQTRGDVAQKIANAFADGKTGGYIWRSCINRLFTILPTPLEVKRKKTRQIKYCAVSKVRKISVPKWWADFIDNSAIDKLDLTTVVKRSDVVGSENWLEGPVGHSIFERLIAELLMGGDPAKLLAHWIKQGNCQVNASDAKGIEAQVNLLRDLQRRKLDKDLTEEIKWTENLRKNFGSKLQEKLAMEFDLDEEKDRDKLKQAYEYNLMYKPNDLDRYFKWLYSNEEKL